LVAGEGLEPPTSGL